MMPAAHAPAERGTPFSSFLTLQPPLAVVDNSGSELDFRTETITIGPLISSNGGMDSLIGIKVICTASQCFPSK